MKDYFFIDINFLKGSSLYPFHIYVYSPNLDIYSMFLQANSPLTKEKKAFLIYILQQGGVIAINMAQKMTFLRALSLKQEDVPDLAPQDVDPLELERLKKYNNYKKELEAKYDYAAKLHKAFQENDFSEVIRRCKIEVSILPLNISHTTSMAATFAEYFLKNDCFSNRVIATCFYIAKIIGRVAHKEYGELFMASLVYQIGETQLPYPLVRNAKKNIEYNQYRLFHRHVGHSSHMLKKINADLSKDCLKIVDQHHERFDGKGYPENIKATFINPNALILGAVSHIFEYAEGRFINSSPTPYEVLKRLADRDAKKLLETEFGEEVLGAIKKILLTRIENPEKESAA